MQQGRKAMNPLSGNSSSKEPKPYELKPNPHVPLVTQLHPNNNNFFLLFSVSDPETDSLNEPLPTPVSVVGPSPPKFKVEIASPATNQSGFYIENIVSRATESTINQDYQPQASVNQVMDRPTFVQQPVIMSAMGEPPNVGVVGQPVVMQVGLSSDMPVNTPIVTPMYQPVVNEPMQPVMEDHIMPQQSQRQPVMAQQVMPQQVVPQQVRPQRAMAQQAMPQQPMAQQAMQQQPIVVQQQQQRAIRPQQVRPQQVQPQQVMVSQVQHQQHQQPIMTPQVQQSQPIIQQAAQPQPIMSSTRPVAASDIRPAQVQSVLSSVRPVATPVAMAAPPAPEPVEEQHQGGQAMSEAPLEKAVVPASSAEIPVLTLLRELKAHTVGPFIALICFGGFLSAACELDPTWLILATSLTSLILFRVLHV